MKNEPTHRRTDITAFARAQQSIKAHDIVQDFERLAEELPAQAPASALQLPVAWQARGEWQATADGSGVPWLHLEAETTIPLQCQRCLGLVEVTASAVRSFRFVRDEATAEAEDDASEEDVLVASPEFDLAALVEDELLMALPLVPRHDVCPTEVKLSAQDDDFAADGAEKPNPFAVLQKLRKGDGQ